MNDLLKSNVCSYGAHQATVPDACYGNQMELMKTDEDKDGIYRAFNFSLAVPRALAQLGWTASETCNM